MHKYFIAIKMGDILTNKFILLQTECDDQKYSAGTKKKFQNQNKFCSTDDVFVKILLIYKFNRYSSLFVLYFLVLLDFCLS